MSWPSSRIVCLRLFLAVTGCFSGAVSLAETPGVNFPSHCEIFFTIHRNQAWRTSLNPMLRKYYEDMFREEPVLIGVYADKKVPRKSNKRAPGETKIAAEPRVAAITVAAEKAGFLTPIQMIKDFENLSPRQKKAIEKALAQVTFSNTSTAAFQKSMLNLYRKLSPKDPLWRRVVAMLKPNESIDNYLMRQMEVAIVKQGFADMAKTLGLSNTRASRMRARVKSMAINFFHSVMSTGSVLAAVGGDIFGLYLPPIHLLKLNSKKVPKEIWDKAMREGVFSVKDDLRKLYGKRAGFDYYYNSVAKAITMAFIAVLVADQVEDKYAEWKLRKLIDQKIAEDNKKVNAAVDEVEEGLAGIHLTYDWAFPKVTLEAMWEEQIAELEIETGKKADRKSAKFVALKENFMEEGLWRHVTDDAVLKTVMKRQPFSEDELFRILTNEFSTLRKEALDLNSPRWTKRKKDFLELVKMQKDDFKFDEAQNPGADTVEPETNQ